MPVPSIPPPSSRTSDPSSHAEVNSIISSNGSHTPPKPVGASNDLRYDNRHHANKTLKYEKIPALTRKFSNKSCPWLKDAIGWERCVHPEGALYLYNNSKRTFTEANVDEAAFHLVDECVDELRSLACTRAVDLEDNDIELVVQVAQAGVDSEHSPCQYYFVDHANRSLFWLHDHDEVTNDIFCGLGGITDDSHIGYALEAEYWAHCERYPNHKLDRVNLIKELRAVVMYTSAEVITSDTSLSPFDAAELSSILELMNHLQVNAEDNDDFPHPTCVIARFMNYFSRARFFNFCGLPCARLEADKSVYKEVNGWFHPLTKHLSLVLDAMLFWAPQAHYNDLRRVWVDECINAPRWKDFSRNLMSEWTGITIYSTVMLAVDVSFLAVPNVYIDTSQSVGVIATYVSIIFITGSLIVSLLLARQTQRYGPESAEGAAQLLSKMAGTFFGIRAIATVHSLPYAMLMWGMIFFATSFLFNVFNSTKMAMLASVASGSVVVTMFILWFIWAAREVHIFTRLAKFVKHLIIGDAQS
ncbi:hypothetical protein AZE42_09252 [Rhizopogon vesiculosus]|uniref:WW domain-containing protein n=1 Tax=Rhizopogon vesiculosus TaxID=180088 RepID=A0A1J8R5M9_9AGAM|nr:hypothetical protein AZE42_09252 [Rhizopogon vesiculosus]